VSEYLTCFACEREPTRQCSRCGRPYCEDHGEELCDVCLEPASGVPSFSLYRGSLLALLIATALAVWLLIQPSGDESEAGLRPIILTPTSEAAAAETPSAEETPSGEQTPAAGETPGAEATATPEAAGPGGTYTVVSGDSLFSICAAQVPGMDPNACVEQVVQLNQLPGPDAISVGQELTLP
jgi:hypothetical protein